MRRLFWIGVGAVGAVVLARRVERAARRYTPAGLAEQVEVAGEATGSALRDAATRFQVARRTREEDLVRTLLVTPEDGDPGAVFGRGSRSRPTGGAPSSARPGARVDPDEPLYEF